MVTDLDGLTLGQQLEGDLRRAVWAWDAGRARSQQTSLGASEVGHPCDRFLYYKAAGVPEERSGDTWLATLGTAAHEVFAEALATLGWLVELPVEIAPGVRGTVDAYREPLALDHKVLGTTSHRALRLHGPKQQYRVQLHLYGFGLIQAGHPVEEVAIAAWPRSNFLEGTNGLHVWTEAYDEQVVEEALQRWYRIAEAAPVTTANPALVAALATADGPCSWCPFRDPDKARTDPGAACAGDPSTTEANLEGAKTAALRGLG